MKFVEYIKYQIETPKPVDSTIDKSAKGNNIKRGNILINFKEFEFNFT